MELLPASPSPSLTPPLSWLVSPYIFIFTLHALLHSRCCHSMSCVLASISSASPQRVLSVVTAPPHCLAASLTVCQHPCELWCTAGIGDRQTYMHLVTACSLCLPASPLCCHSILSITLPALVLFCQHPCELWCIVGIGDKHSYMHLMIHEACVAREPWL